MLIPLSWLREYVDWSLPEATLIERLTLAGLEATGARVYGLPTPPGVRVKPDEAGPVWDRDKIVTARVLKVEQHPNADKLKLVTLEYGTAEPKVVVTGAPNIKVGDSGQNVILALTGAVLFDGHATPKKLMELKPTQLRGVPSDAMVCSGFELGTTDDHEGIIILPDDAPVGVPLADVMGDVVVEVDILPNMARCLAMLGVAREVAAIAGTSVRTPKAGAAATGPTVVGRLAVAIEDPSLSARYAAWLVEGVSVRPSPTSIQTRLTLAGMRPINSVVDATNYVMLEYGQPLHAFDYDVLLKRAGGKPPTITVRPAKFGEMLRTLDNVERKLTPEQLVIADAAGPIALAGVMGGLETEVSASTTRVLLESANFDFVSIRRTAKALDLHSEASLRFSRGIHPEQVLPAGQRAAELLALHSGGTIAAGVVDVYPAPVRPQQIELRLSEVKRLLGVAMTMDETNRVLTALDFKVEPAGETLHVTAPTNRVDIQAGESDLIEELARVGGYDRLPATQLADPLPTQLGNHELTLEERARDLLATYGLQEFITYSLTTPDREALFAPEGDYVTLVNPISVERSSLRHTILGGLLECTAANLRHTSTVRAFEIGPVFIPQTGQKLPLEHCRLGIVLTGSRGEGFWADASAGGDADFFDLKGIVETFARDFHLPKPSIRAAECRYLHPGKSAELVIDGVGVGSFGELHPKVAAAFDLGRRSILVGEFDLTAMLSRVPDRFAFAPVPRFQAALRDIAVIVSEGTSAEKVAGEIRAGGGDLLAEARLFDVYRGPSIPEGTKSLAYALVYQAFDRTLADKEIDKAHKKIEERVKHVLKAQIRGKE